jgi:hypothetical protein
MAARMAMMAMTTSNSISVKPPDGFRQFSRLKFETIFGFIVYLIQITPPAIFFNSFLGKTRLNRHFPYDMRPATIAGHSVSLTNIVSALPVPSNRFPAPRPDS